MVISIFSNFWILVEEAFQFDHYLRKFLQGPWFDKLPIPLIYFKGFGYGSVVSRSSMGPWNFPWILFNSVGSYCWWKKSGVHHLRERQFIPLFYSFFSIPNGGCLFWMSEPSNSSTTKMASVFRSHSKRRPLQVKRASASSVSLTNNDAGRGRWGKLSVLLRGSGYLISG